jgi:PH domain
MEGSLKVWINLLYRWQSQFFILHDGVLSYCDRKGGKMIGAIHMKVAKVALTAEDHLRIIINTGTGELHLRAGNVQEKSRWVSCLRQAQDHILAKERESAGLNGSVGSDILITNEDQHKIISSPTLALLTEKIAELWCIQAQFDEALSLIQAKIERQSPLYSMFQNVQKIGAELKVGIFLGLMLRGS